MVETGTGGPGRESGFAELGEAFLEAFEDVAGERIARRDGASGAGIAALEIYFTNFETDDATFVFSEELIFPESGDAVDFERRAEALAGFVECGAGESFVRRKPFVPQGEPLSYGFERGSGDNRGAVRDRVVGKAIFGIAHDDFLVEEDAEPFGGVFVGAGESEGARGDFAAIARDGEGDFAQVGGVVGPDEMDGGSALAVDPLAVDGIEGPCAVERQAAGRADAGFGDGDGVERFDGVEADVDEVRGRLRRRHEESLAEEGSEKEGKGLTQRTRRAQSSLKRRGEEPKRAGPPAAGRLKRPAVHIRMKRGKKEGRSAILSLSSAAAPLGAKFIAERSYRGGISDVYPHPARLNLRAQRWPLRSLWLNPALCDSPVYRRGAKSNASCCCDRS